ncbi:MAG TPA: LPS assembly protein LptD, partial [Myxococcaceae bacterium]|nr:LPS assembly protein LptD [Myxococcaceae bacterium]
MSLLAPLAFVLLLGSQLPPGAGAPRAGDLAELRADQLTYEPTRQVLVARGHAELSGGTMRLRADELTYDQRGERAVARGNVTFVSGLVVAIAEEVAVDLATQEATVKGGLFLQKSGVSPETLLRAQSADELKALGQTTVALSGASIRRLSQNEFEVEGLTFTPCDCKPTDPSWRIEARRAVVKVGENAVLTLPIVYVYSVPVFAVPVLDLPLTDRRSGLLIPRPTATAQNGFALEQPVFLTLGQSYDVTFTPGWFFGGRLGTRTDPATGAEVLDPVTGAPRLFAPDLGVQGPRLITEFRYAPSEGTRGRATLGLLYDFRPVRDPVSPSALLADEARARGLRGDVSLQHVQDLGSGWHDRIDFSAISDGYLLRDLTTDVLQREDQYLRSSAQLFHRADDSYAGLEVVFRQNITYGYSLFGLDRSRTGEPSHGPGTFQRLPALRYELPERPLFGPVFGGLSLEYARLSPLGLLYGDEGSDGVFDPTRPDPDGTQGDRRFGPGEREARDRLDLRPRLSASFAAGPFARFTPYLAWRQDVYLGERTGAAAQRGYPLAGLVVESELSRTFGERNELRHAIRPWVELRYVPRVFGGAPSLYDEVDRAVPRDGLFQLVAELRQRLWMKEGYGEGAGIREVLRLDLGQGVDLRGGGLGDSYARLSGALGWVTLDAVGRYNVPAAQVTQLSATCGLDDGRGDALYA